MARLFLALALSQLLACGDDAGDAAIDVSWTIGGSTCNQSGVSKMLVRLYQDGEVQLEHEATCTDGTTRVGGVPAGTYVVEVTAYRTGSDDPVYVGHVSGVTVPKGGVVTAPEVALEEAPGALDLSWRFADGKLCRFAGVTQIDIRIGVFDAAGRRAAERSLACDPAPEAAPEEDRPGVSYLDGALGVVIDRLLPGDYTLNLFAYGEDSELPVYYGNAQASVTVYTLTPVDVVLDVCPTGANSPCL